MRTPLFLLALLPLPLGEGWGEGDSACQPIRSLQHRALTLTLSEGHEGAPSWPSEREQHGARD